MIVVGLCIENPASDHPFVASSHSPFMRWMSMTYPTSSGVQFKAILILFIKPHTYFTFNSRNIHRTAVMLVHPNPYLFVAVELGNEPKIFLFIWVGS